jgi:3-hydroxyisobutyrate dehydrogenase-like beta-hydroxyacid dehydrogenase
VTPRIGFVGAGQLGGPMVERLVAAGRPVTVHARRPERRSELEALGATAVEDPREAAAAADVLVCCVFSDEQLRTVLIDDNALGAVPAGSVVVSHVTGSPALIDELGERAPRDVEVVDAPVSGSADQVRSGTLTVLIGGDDDAARCAAGVVGAYADPIVHVGRRGDALRAKIVNNVLFAANVRLAGEVHRIAGQLGMDFDVLVDAIGRCSGATRALTIASSMGNERLQTGSRHFLEKDVALVADVAAASGLELGELLRVASVYLPNRSSGS